MCRDKVSPVVKISIMKILHKNIINKEHLNKTIEKYWYQMINIYLVSVVEVTVVLALF